MLRCEQCLWGGSCVDNEGECTYYTPVDEEEIVSERDRIRREEFCGDWLIYASEYEDDAEYGVES